MENQPFILSCGIAATSSYQYALYGVFKALQQNLFFLSDVDYKGHLLLATEKKISANFIEKAHNLLGAKWTIHNLIVDAGDNVKNYKQQATLTIDLLYDAIFCKTRELNSDYLLTNESDVILGHDVLEYMFHMIKTPNNLFDVIVSPYPSNGGDVTQPRDFLNLGFGDSQHHIYKDIETHERLMPERYFKAKETWEKEIQLCKVEDRKKGQKLFNKLQWLEKRAQKYPPKGNIFYLNSLGYRKRGWSSAALPGAAAKYNFLGCVRWMGLGANLFSKRSLKYLDHWHHGNLGGTSDLSIVHNSIFPKGMNICSLPHAPSHHVIKDKSSGKLYIAYAYHEEMNKETEGHLRCRMLPYYNFDDGDRFTPKDKDSDQQEQHLPED